MLRKKVGGSLHPHSSPEKPAPLATPRGTDLLQRCLTMLISDCLNSVRGCVTNKTTGNNPMQRQKRWELWGQQQPGQPGQKQATSRVFPGRWEAECSPTGFAGTGPICTEEEDPDLRPHTLRTKGSALEIKRGSRLLVLRFSKGGRILHPGC